MRNPTPSNSVNVCCAVLLCMVLSWQTAALNSKAQAPAQEPAKASTVLAAGRHALKGGEFHSYTVNRSAGQFLYALVEQEGIDVRVTLFQPDGTQIGVCNSPNGSWGSEPVLLVAGVSGEYRVEVSAPNAKA